MYDFEGGIKSTWLDGRLQTQFGGYYQTLDDFQGVFATPADVLGSIIRNADGTSKIYGLELSAQAQFGDLSLDFAGAWNVTELGTFDNVTIPENLVQFYPGASVGDTVDLTGSQSPYSPEITLSIGAEYELRFGDTTVTPRIDFAYIGEQKDGLYDDAPPIVLAERALVNVQVRVEHGQWYGRAYMDNATDHIYIGGIQERGQLRYLGPRRMYGITIGRNFDW